MNNLKEKWLNWFKWGMGLDLGGYTAKEIIKIAETLDFNSYITQVGDLDCHAVLKDCIKIMDYSKNASQKKISKGYRKTYHRQRTDKGFFNVITRRK